MKYNIYIEIKMWLVNKMKLKEYRKNKGFTQTYIAKILGISQQAYANKEAGKRGFTTKELIIIEKIMNVKIADIYDKLSKEIDRELEVHKK